MLKYVDSYLRMYLSLFKYHFFKTKKILFNTLVVLTLMLRELQRKVNES